MTCNTTSPSAAEVEAVVRPAIAQWAVPGLALGVLHDGTTDAWGFGITSVETEQAVRSDTLFQIGSISKVITTTLLMQLVDEGRLDLDAPVRRSIPTLKLEDDAAAVALTTRHLLTHTAGFFGDRFEDYGRGDDALARAIAEFGTLQQYSRPGEFWSYANTAFQLAGYLVEQILGLGFEAAARDRLLMPLGMTRSFYFADQAITYPLAVGHSRSANGEATIEREWARSRCGAARGGLISTAPDLLRFAGLQMNDGMAGDIRLLSSASIRAMQTPQVARPEGQQGLGWMLSSIDGARIVQHGGATNGFNALLTIVPEKRFAMAALTNSSIGTAAIRPVEEWLLDRYAGLRQQKPQRVTLSPETLAGFAGRYERPGVAAIVTAVPNGLDLRLETTNLYTGTMQPATLMHAVPVTARQFMITTDPHAESLVDFLDGKGGLRYIRVGGRITPRIGDA
ncbi:MAG: serine hydrolase domain-containing protein [Dehalococcoidia bacterium]